MYTTKCFLFRIAALHTHNSLPPNDSYSAIVSPVDCRVCCRCNALAVACYASAGVVFGVATGGAAVAPAIVGCNAALGTCMAACWGVTGAAAVTPTL